MVYSSRIDPCFFLLFACRSESPTDTDEKIVDTIIDNDGDGLADEDCDDNNSLINPNAEELCDGADNTGNGDIDEGVLDDFTSTMIMMGLEMQPT